MRVLQKVKTKTLSDMYTLLKDSEKEGYELAGDCIRGKGGWVAVLAIPDDQGTKPFRHELDIGNKLTSNSGSEDALEYKIAHILGTVIGMLIVLGIIVLLVWSLGGLLRLIFF
jgi:hypothetical protein